MAQRPEETQLAWSRCRCCSNGSRRSSSIPRGGRLSLDNEPFVDTFGNDLVFNKSKLQYSHYLRYSRRPAWCWPDGARSARCSGHARADGTGQSALYAGGGGSVAASRIRQPASWTMNTIGGRSLFEASGEVRARVTRRSGWWRSSTPVRRSPRPFRISTTSSGSGSDRASAISVRSGHSASASASR